MWFTLFLISMLINTILFFYVKWLLNTVAAINEDVSVISATIQGFLMHLQGVHELETFYGDQTLKNLLTGLKRKAWKFMIMNSIQQVTTPHGHCHGKEKMKLWFL